MTRSIRCLLILVLSLLPIAMLCAAPKPDPDVDRLQARIAALDTDPALADLGGLERLKARQALAFLQTARSRDRDQALYLAQHRVDAADAAAHAELLQQQSAQLDRERDQIMIDASRIAAEQARREAEILRLQKLASEEESQRLAAQAEAERVASAQAISNAQAASAQARKLADARGREAQLARKEAELASAVAADSMTDTAALPPMHRDGGRNVYTVSGSAFASGRATLTSAGIASLNRLAGVLGKSASLQIAGFTDSQGSDAANQSLSRQRADAVRGVLIDAGMDGRRITAVGRGKADPVASNGSAEGRARNRRVEIVVQ
jgi:outer membrane protein OmpA-like peptidoglycan-associated protein